MNQRACGDCTLCCKLLPMSADGRSEDVAERLIRKGLADATEFHGMVANFDKAAGERCPFQRHHKGCTVYSKRPFGCRSWSCRWLTNDDTGDLARPDRSHYVVDEVPDFVTAAEDRTLTQAVIQIWCDPDYPLAHRDPALRAYLLRRWRRDGMLALVRFNNVAALFLYFDDDGRCHEHTTNMRTEREHTIEEKVAAGLMLDRDDAQKRLDWALNREPAARTRSSREE